MNSYKKESSWQAFVFPTLFLTLFFLMFFSAGQVAYAGTWTVYSNLITGSCGTGDPNDWHTWVPTSPVSCPTGSCTDGTASAACGTCSCGASIPYCVLSSTANCESPSGGGGGGGSVTCGTANNKTYSPSGPPGSTPGAICSSGNATISARTSNGYWDGWSWTCGSNSCSANLSPGVCGSANGTTRATAPSTVAERCGAGISSAVSGSGPWSWSCTGTSCSASKSSSPAIGNFERTDASSCTLTGWAFDPDSSSTSIAVHVYKDASAFAGGTIVAVCSANGYRSDVNAAYGISGSHGFSCTLPASYAGTGAHNLYVHAIDTSGSPNNVIDGSPKSLTCTPAPTCGSSNGQTFTTQPTTNLCTSGSVAGPYYDGSSGWYWYCNNYGAYCSAYQSVASQVNCGTNATTYASTTTAWPSVAATAFCSPGAIVGNQPAFPSTPGGTSSWTCKSSNSINSLSCSAQRQWAPALLVCPNPAPTLEIGGTTQLSARYFSGTSSTTALTCASSGYSTVTNSATWSPTVSVSGAANVSNASGTKGKVTAIGGGVETITATYSGVTGSTNVTVAALNVLVTANPSSGDMPLDSTITATVSGTVSGTINYKFYCNGETLSHEDLAQSATSLSYICHYDTSGARSVKVIVEQGTLSASGTVTVTVNSIPCNPSVSGLPANTQFWPLDDVGLVVGDNTTSVYSASNTSKKCEYRCHAPAERVGSACVLCGECDPPQNHCAGETWADNCGNANVCTGGTKDCRTFFREVAP